MPKKDKNWIKRHISDPYVQAATKAGWRSRASLKLLQIHERDRLFKPGQKVVDLGAAPGGWCQVLKKQVGAKGIVSGVDLLTMSTIQDVFLIEGDFTDVGVQDALLAPFKSQRLDWVVSDMAPDMTGHKAVDQPRAIGLCEHVLEFAVENLKPDGGLLIKVFHGEGFDEFYKALRSAFTKVVTRKPDASRGESREVYLLARNLKLG